MTPILIARALRILIHARNSRGALKVQIRALIRADIQLLRKV